MNLTPYHLDVVSAKVCPYCNSTTRIVSETDIYGREYKGRKLIACVNFPKCDSYVGTHDDGTTLGRLANKELRTAKRNAHLIFDKVWVEKFIDRDSLYEQLADYLELPDAYTHIGMFSVKTCKRVEQWAKERYNNYKAAK